tara:strand:- start:187 stop:507 length:321 start_codon:yes stop_codon:yes gene_type:complete
MKLIKENENILSVLSKVSGISEDRLKKRGPHHVSSWVHLGMYYAREEEGQTLAAIGETFNRTFAGVHVGWRKVKKALQDPRFKDTIEENLEAIRKEVKKLKTNNET